MDTTSCFKLFVLVFIFSVGDSCLDVAMGDNRTYCCQNGSVKNCVTVMGNTSTGHTLRWFVEPARAGVGQTPEVFMRPCWSVYGKCWCDWVQKWAQDYDMLGPNVYKYSASGGFHVSLIRLVLRALGSYCGFEMYTIVVDLTIEWLLYLLFMCIVAVFFTPRRWLRRELLWMYIMLMVYDVCTLTKHGWYLLIVLFLWCFDRARLRPTAVEALLKIVTGPFEGEIRRVLVERGGEVTAVIARCNYALSDVNACKAETRAIQIVTAVFPSLSFNRQRYYAAAVLVAPDAIAAAFDAIQLQGHTVRRDKRSVARLVSEEPEFDRSVGPSGLSKLLGLFRMDYGARVRKFIGYAGDEAGKKVIYSTNSFAYTVVKPHQTYEAIVEGLQDEEDFLMPSKASEYDSDELKRASGTAKNDGYGFRFMRNHIVYEENDEPAFMWFKVRDAQAIARSKDPEVVGREVAKRFGQSASSDLAKQVEKWFRNNTSETEQERPPEEKVAIDQQPVAREAPVVVEKKYEPQKPREPPADRLMKQEKDKLMKKWLKDHPGATPKQQIDAAREIIKSLKVERQVLDKAPRDISPDDLDELKRRSNVLYDLAQHDAANRKQLVSLMGYLYKHFVWATVETLVECQKDDYEVYEVVAPLLLNKIVLDDTPNASATIHVMQERKRAKKPVVNPESKSDVEMQSIDLTKFERTVAYCGNVLFHGVIIGHAVLVPKHVLNLKGFALPCSVKSKGYTHSVELVESKVSDQRDVALLRIKGAASKTAATARDIQLNETVVLHVVLAACQLDQKILLGTVVAVDDAVVTIRWSNGDTTKPGYSGCPVYTTGGVLVGINVGKVLRNGFSLIERWDEELASLDFQ